MELGGSKKEQRVNCARSNALDFRLCSWFKTSANMLNGWAVAHLGATAPRGNLDPCQVGPLLDEMLATYIPAKLTKSVNLGYFFFKF